jgi:hypothetical protein
MDRSHSPPGRPKKIGTIVYRVIILWLVIRVHKNCIQVLINAFYNVGTALYVFFILANTVPHVFTTAATQTTCSFTLDRTPAGSFTHTPSDSLEFEYKALAFSKQGLENHNHKLIITVADAERLGRRLFLSFDYAIYT